VMAGALPAAPVLWLAGLYSVGAHGIMTLNDFKAIEGDAKLGIRSLPVTLGPRRAALLACAVMAAPQAVVVALLLDWNRPIQAGIVGLSLVLQGLAMLRLMKDPARFAPWYNGTGVTLYVLGMMAAATATAGLGGAA
jgi:chlorophyll/bacteriochlorophyll a synthase